MDNKSINIVSDSAQDFEYAMKLATSRYKTIGYRINKNRLILYWAKSDLMTPLPYEFGVEQIISFVWGWVEKTSPDYAKPDHDGDNEKGFNVYNEAWGHVEGEWQAFVAIRPIWAMYGK